MTRKLYIYKKMTTFICPVCKRTKTINISELIEMDQKIQIKCLCACGFSDRALLERRQYARKEIFLPGIYSRYCFDHIFDKGSILVTELSRSGLKFRPNEDSSFRIGERIKIIFNLNDAEKSLIKKKAVVINIDPDFQVGIQFCTKDLAGPIGPFLFS